uniref:Transposase IS4 n=1 Tax=Trepomonas sp. PC1 TaxID=1076344 RepID=A0A146KJ90_9EUKA|eukprot:JAP95501.1 Transposase IS4 [Trepomonas sp. PC1]
MFDYLSISKLLSSISILDRDPVAEPLEDPDLDDLGEEWEEVEEEDENEQQIQSNQDQFPRLTQHQKNRARIDETSNLCQEWIQLFADRFIANMGEVHDISLDESLLKCQSRTKNLQYIPKKPGKWGLLLRTICESHTGYCINMYMVQSGVKVKNIDLCRKLFEPLPIRFCQVAMDSFYSSIDVFQYFMDKRCKVLGTIMPNRCKNPKFDDIVPEGYQQLPKQKIGRKFYLTKYQVKKNKKVIIAHSYLTDDMTHTGETPYLGKGKPWVQKIQYPYFDSLLCDGLLCQTSNIVFYLFHLESQMFIERLDVNHQPVFQDFLKYLSGSN